MSSAAVTRGFQDRDSILLIGQMGTWANADGRVGRHQHRVRDCERRWQNEMRPDQVMLIVAPPHLIDKWKRELASIAPKAVIETTGSP